MPPDAPPTPPLPWKARAELRLAAALLRWRQRWPRLLEAAAPPHFNGYGALASDKQTAPSPNASADTPSYTIPPILWSYWDGPTPPLLVQRCMAGWQRLHPHFALRILNPDSLGQWLPSLPAALLPSAGTTGAPISPAKRADWIRLALLHRYGGIWLDASTLLTQPLDWVLAEQARSSADFVGFYLGQYTQQLARPVVENWFMAAPPASPLIGDWLQLFTDAVLPRSGADYIAHLQAQGLYEQARQGIDIPEYLSMHLALQVLLLRQPQRYRLHLSRAEDGPFFYHAQSRWNRTALKWRLLLAQATPGAVPPLIKLRAPDRRRFDAYLARQLYLPTSVVGRWLGTSC